MVTFAGLKVFRKQLERVGDDKAYGLPVVDGDGRFDSAFQVYIANEFEMLARRQWLGLIYSELFFMGATNDDHGNVRGAGLVCRIAHQQLICTGLRHLDLESSRRSAR